MSEGLTREDFAGRVGERFTAHASEQGPVLELELVEVREGGEAPEGHRKPFALEFRHDDERYLPQQTFKVEHGELGDLAIFLVPLGPKEGAMRYEAVFG